MVCLNMNSIDKEWVVAYYNLELSIIPLGYQKKTPAIGIKRKKYHSTQPTPDEIKKWYEKGLFQNIGVITGNVSDNLICFDFDYPEIFSKLELDITELIKKGAWVVMTPKEMGRYHVYFRSEKSINFTNKNIYNKK